MALNGDIEHKCREWATAPSRHWQILNRAKWKYQFRGMTIVRFVDSVKMDEDMLRSMLEYLTSDACLNDLEAYNQGLTPEGKYKPTKAWYELGQSAANGVRSINLYHALCTEPEANADGPFLVEDGCAYKVWLEYHWNEPSVPDVQPSESGISYRISNISHDPDTDLYSYVIEKRERVQQDIAEYFTAKSVYEDQKEEVHLGVKQDKVATTGKAASVGNGVIVRRKLSKNQDCTSDVHNTTTIDKAVSNSSVTISKTLEGTNKVTVNRNMPAPASTDNLDIGESVENTKTDSGLYNQTIRTRIKNALLKIAETCVKTLFSHRHGTTTVQGSDPGFTHVDEAHDGVVTHKSVSRTSDGSYRIEENETTEKPVISAAKRERQTIYEKSVSQSDRSQSAAATGSSASGGVIVETSTEKTEGGLHNNTKTTKTEKSVTKAVEHSQMTLNGLRVSRTDKNQPSPGSAINLKVGESVTNRKTEGGLYDITTESAAVKGAGKVGESCHQDKFTHGHSTQNNVLAADAPEPEHTFEKGVIVDKRVSLNRNGTADVSESVNTAKPFMQQYTYQRSDGSVVHVVQYRNQDAQWSGYPNGAVGLQVSDSVNAYGLHDGSVHWLTNAPKSVQISDLKFIKHGESVTLYEVAYKKRTRRLYHRSGTIQFHHICGDAYTDYLSDKQKADPKRTTSGILGVRLIRGPYYDKDGNALAEWEWVQLTAPTSDSAWTPCDSTCKHPMRVTGVDVYKEYLGLLKMQDGKAIDGVSNGSSGSRTSIAESINALPMMLAAALSGQSVKMMKERMKGKEE